MEIKKIIMYHVKKFFVSDTIRWTMFFVISCLLGIVIYTIFTSNQIVNDFVNEDFKGRQVLRVPMQIRYQIVRSLNSCKELKSIKKSQSIPMIIEKCYSGIEGAMAQVSSELVIQDYPEIKDDLEYLYSMVEKLDQQIFDNDQIDKNLNLMEQKVDTISEKLGVSESNYWNQSTTRYSKMIQDSILLYKLSLIAVALVFLSLCYIGFLNIIKYKDNKKLIQAQKSIEDQRVTLIHSSKMSTLGEMASGVAHEINNPLAVIHSKAERILRLSETEKLTSESAIDIANKIILMADRISKIISGLRSFARDGEGDPMTEVNLQQVISETIELCYVRMKNHGIELQMELPLQPIKLLGRATQLSQVILNLLNNAHDAIESQKTKKWIKLELINHENEVVIVVTDSGQGIPFEIQEKMFNPFFTTKGIGKGTGLGLSISMGIIKAHHGQIIINNSHPNTQFVITLPKKIKNTVMMNYKPTNTSKSA